MLKLSEMWKPVVGFDGLYEVSDCGQVRSLERVETIERVRFGKRDRHDRVRAGRPLPQQNNQRNYMQINLWKGGKMYTRTVHRLVLEAFVGLRPTVAHETRHLDGDRHNNLVGNLVWGTHKENVADSIVHGTWMHGERHGHAKLTDVDAHEIRNAVGSQRAIAKKFGVSQSTVWQIKRGNYWKHLNA